MAGREREVKGLGGGEWTRLTFVGAAEVRDKSQKPAHSEC